jgi:phosphoribosylaminoimidazole carboxylase / phosphoribosylaminoimidazole-succinocarboxamide synthase
MEKLVKGEMIIEGKTKRIFSVAGNNDIVIVENKSAITALDDPSRTRKFASKAISATATTCRVFELLNACGVPTAFVEQLSPTEFIMKKSKMAPLEVVARRYAVGSYLKRHPELETVNKTKPKRFHRLEVEFFLKTTDGKFGDLFSDLKEKDEHGDFTDKVDDPLIVNPRDMTWKLAHSKNPSWTKEAELSRKEITVQVQNLDTIIKMEDTCRRAFLVLEKAWAILGFDLIDYKIEFDDQGRISDVIDNDSWRLWKNGEQFDKQVFRDFGEEKLDVIERNYQFIAEMSARLILPKQALVFWRGSEKDPKQEIPTVPGIVVIDIAKSGHKETMESLLNADRLVADYPQGGVIVASVGRSNGLGPILSSHIPWPVISCPATLKEFSEDVWSSIRMPSGVPHLTAWPEANAFNAALTILSQLNPVAYMQLQLNKEALDNFIA